MHRRRFLQTAVGAGGLLWLGAGTLGRFTRSLAAELPVPAKGPRRVTRVFDAFGTEMSITVLHTDEEAARSAIDHAVAEVLRIDAAMSLYRSESDLVRLNQRGAIDRPDPYLVDVLRAGAHVAHTTDGAFDFTVQPLWELWAEAGRARREPAEGQIEAARRRVDWRRVTIEGERVRLLGRGAAVTLNGIAQGFASDRAVAALRRRGIEQALVNAGEVAPLGGKEGGKPWAAGIQHPLREDAYVALAKLDGRCLATSGDYAARPAPGQRFKHLFDPRTGRSPVHYASLSVLAPSATLADALSTALYVLPPHKALGVARRIPGVDVLAVLANGKLAATPGFPT